MNDNVPPRKQTQCQKQTNKQKFFPRPRIAVLYNTCPMALHNWNYDCYVTPISFTVGIWDPVLDRVLEECTFFVYLTTGI